MGENPNNNADFDAAMDAEYPTLKPAPDLTRQEFVNMAKNLLDEMAADHEEHTGIEDNETRSWEYWSTELTNAYLNS